MATQHALLLEADPQRQRTQADTFLEAGLGSACALDQLVSLSAGDPDVLAVSPEWGLACRVAASRGLCKSELLPRFLLYVCREYLLGRARQISEQRIGIRVFNRPPGYNPGEDNIVRSYARLLRNRLDAYFANEGAHEPMRITIERGGYIPSFHSRSVSAEPVAVSREISVANGAPLLESADEVVSADRSMEGSGSSKESQDGEHRGEEGRRYTLRTLWLACIGGIVAAVVAMLAVWIGVAAWGARQQPAHSLWIQMFASDRDTLIVPADSGLGILENLTKHQVSVEDYANGSFFSELHPPAGLDAGNLNDLRRQRYTSVVDLDITSRLTRLPEFLPSRTQIHYARSMTPEDMKNSNVILLGSKHSNPWVSLFEPRMNFKLEYMAAVDDSYVLNEHPVSTEQKVYRNETNAPRSSTYGSIAYLPGLGGAGHVLIIQGLNMAGTQAAADALFNPSVIEPLLRQATLPDRTLRPFELLVQTSSVGATAPEVQVIATRIYH